MKINSNSALSKMIPKNQLFSKASLTSKPAKNTAEKTSNSKEEQVKKLQKKKAQKLKELQALEKKKLSKEEKQKQTDALRKEIQAIDAEILKLSSPQNSSKNTKTIDGKA